MAQNTFTIIAFKKLGSTWIQATDCDFELCLLVRRKLWKASLRVNCLFRIHVQDVQSFPDWIRDPYWFNRSSSPANPWLRNLPALQHHASMICSSRLKYWIAFITTKNLDLLDDLEELVRDLVKQVESCYCHCRLHHLAQSSSLGGVKASVKFRHANVVPRISNLGIQHLMSLKDKPKKLETRSRMFSPYLQVLSREVGFSERAQGTFCFELDWVQQLTGRIAA